MNGYNPASRIKSLSMVFPAFNDGGTIASMVSTAWIAAKSNCENFEIIVVNDGSTDYTSVVLGELEERYSELRVIHHAQNQGYGAALKTGFANAQNDWVFYTDGDSQYNPLELTELINALHEEADLANGYKLSRNDSILRIIIGRAYHYFVKFFFNIPIRDVDCDFRLIPRKILNEIKLESNSGAICLELVKKISDLGYRFAETPVHHYSRKYGTSQFFVPSRIFRTFRRLAVLYWKLVIKKEHLNKKV